MPKETKIAHPSGEITPAWVSAEMEKNKLKVNDLVVLTGCHQSNISAWVTGIRSMSQPVKCMFFYLFKSFK